MKQKSGRKLLSFLLSLALVLVVGLVPGMSLTAYAATETYTNLIPTSSDTDLTSKQVTFNGYKWYIIADNSTAADAGTVTLLAADTSFGTSTFKSDNSSNSYNSSDVKAYLDNIVAGKAGEGKPNFKAVADAIQPVTLTTYKYASTTEVAETTENAKLYLLSTSEAGPYVNFNFTGAQYGGWWLRSPGSGGRDAAFVDGVNGLVPVLGLDVVEQFGVRPALKLNLSSVIFDSESKTFSLNPASTYTGFGGLITNDTEVTISEVSGKTWYVIANDSSTVTLLSKESFENKVFNSSGAGNDYATSEIKTYVDGLTGEGQPLAGISSVISDLTLIDITTAQGLTETKRKGAGTDWWLRSPGDEVGRAAFVDGESGDVSGHGYFVNYTIGVRPALKLNLSSVIFDSESKTFSLKPAGYNVTITAGSNMTKTTDSGAASQTGLSGAMTDVVYTADTGYYFPENYSVEAVNGISVTRNSYTQITVSGTPTANAAITLTAPTAKTETETYTKLMNDKTVVKFNNYNWYIIADNSTAADAGTVTLLAADTSFETSAFDSTSPYSNAYSGSTVKSKLDALTAEGGAFASVKNAIADTNLSDVGVTGAKLYLLSKSEAEPYANFNFTGAPDGNWWLRSPGNNDESAAFVDGQNGRVYGDGDRVDWHFGVRPALKLNLASVIFSSQSNTFSLKPAGYNVTITAGSNMTKTTDSGAASQTGLSGAMTDVVYTADEGYYFPENYSVEAVNGISVTRDSYTQITVSGTPTANATIMLNPPTAKTDQTAPTGLTATKATSNTATDGKISDVTDTMEYQKSGDTTWTAVGSNQTEITGLTAGTYKVRYAGTADKNASPAATVEVGVKEDQTAPTGLTATKASSSTATDGKISGVTAAMEYQKSGDTTWTAVGSNQTEITGLTAGTYKVRYAGTADKNASPAVTVEVGVKEAQTAPTGGLTATKATSNTATDGKISGVTDAMEYQKDGDTAWTAVGSNQTEITGLTSGTYKVRYAETADKNASPAATVEVGVKEDQTAPTGLTATKATSNTATDGKISGVTDTMEYQKSGDTTWTAVGSNQTEITGLTSGTYSVRYAGTADKNASPAATVEVGVKEDQTAPTGLTATKASSSTATDGKISGVTAAMEYQIDGATTWTAVGENQTEITGLTAGTYKVRYAGTADKNASPAVTVEVGVKANPTVTAPAAKTLTYNGSAQELVTAGTTEGGTMQYALGTATEATQPYTTSIPTATEVGTYYVWYKVVGDANHNDTAPVRIVVMIRDMTVSYDANGGTGAPATQIKKSGESLTLSTVIPSRADEDNPFIVTLDANGGTLAGSDELDAIQHAQYTFNNWNTEPDGSGTSYAPGAVYTTDANVTLYAQWRTRIANSTVSLPIPTRAGWLFLGWGINKSVSSGYTESYTPGYRILYAIWAEPDFTLPAALTEIGEEAFAGAAMKIAYVPDSCTAIGANAFADCASLTKIRLPKDCAIDNAAFTGCELTVCAPAGGTTETWCKANKVPFIAQ